MLAERMVEATMGTTRKRWGCLPTCRPRYLPPEHLLEGGVGVQKTVPPELPQRGFLAGTQSCSTLHHEINVEGEIFLMVENN